MFCLFDVNRNCFRFYEAAGLLGRTSTTCSRKGSCNSFAKIRFVSLKHFSNRGRWVHSGYNLTAGPTSIASSPSRAAARIGETSAQIFSLSNVFSFPFQYGSLSWFLMPVLQTSHLQNENTTKQTDNYILNEKAKQKPKPSFCNIFTFLKKVNSL